MVRSSTPATFTISEGKKLKKVPQGAVLSFLFEADMGEVIQNRQEVTIPIAPKLMEILQGALAWKTKEMDYVCPNIAARYNKNNAIGKNVGNNLVNIDMLRVIRIGLEPSVAVPGRDKKVAVYGFHSLRHSFASFCAEAGGPQATVVSILGADSEIVNKYYTHVGDEAQRQAIAAITGELGGKSAQQRINAPA